MKSLRRIITMLLFLFIANPVLLIAQNGIESVNDNGFRIFNFGDSVEQYGADVCVWFPVGDIIRYKYCGNDTSIYKMDDIRFDDVVLCFDQENRLYSIDYSLYKSQSTKLKEFKKQQDAIYKKISDYLINLYGKDYENDTNVECLSQKWTANNVTVSLKKFGGGNNYWCRFDVKFQKDFQQTDE